MFTNVFRNRFVPIWLIFFFTWIPWNSGAIRMSQPKILLPFHPRIETNFTLEATDGCFLWSSSRPDLVRIEPVGPFQTKNGDKCSLHANVIAHTKQSLRASATVYARDILTGQSVRCDVIIDKIQTIEIVYTTTRLYLEDAPELFKLRAHDQHGSTFSSIEHFSYEWRLLNAAVVDETTTKKSSSGILDATKVIRILRLTDSSYEMSETVRNLESHGSLSYEILLEGLRTGSAFVQAELIDNDFYHQIRTRPVRLSVSANVQFHPSTDVYLLPYSRLGFRLYQIKRQESTDITDLPSTRLLYEVHLINNDAGTLDEQTLIFTATDHADEQSRLELIDRNMKAIDNETYEPSSLMIRIVNIGYLSAVTNSVRPWIYQLGSTYLITVEMFDVNGRKIYPTDNLDLSASIPNEQHRTCFTLTSLYTNGTQYLIRPSCPGRFELEFHLNGMKNKDTIEMAMTASTKQSFEVYLPLSAEPKHVLLPENQQTRSNESPSCPIKVHGGSGDYIFTSRDPTIVSVTSTGDLLSQKLLNSTFIDIFDKKSPELYTNVSVQVVQPDEFHLYPCPVETTIHSTLYLPIQLFYKKQSLTCCSHLDFDVHIDNNLFQYQGLIPSTDPTDQSCALIVLKPLKTSLANLRVQLKKSHLQQSILIGAYEPLTINRDHLLLTTHADYPLKLSNGPLHFQDQEPFKYTIDPSDKHVQFKQDPKNNDFLRVKCLKPLEETQFNITKENPTSKTNRCPSQSTITLDLTCKSMIDSLAFQPMISSTCPMNNDDYFVSYDDRSLSLKIIAYDEHQRIFDNFSSLKLECSIKQNAELADLRLNEHLELIPKGKSGRILVRCSIDKIERQIEIEFLSSIQLKRSVHLIYINESLSPLYIDGGSGHFKFQTNELPTNPLVHLSTNEKNSRVLFLQPLNYGRTSLVIHDQCLPSSTAQVEIIISDFHQLNVFGRSRIEWEKTSLIFLQAKDNEGNLFNLTNLLPLLNVQIDQKDQKDLLNIEYESKSNPDHETLAFRIQPLTIGKTNLRFESLRTTSKTIDFEVFPRFQIEPKHYTILPLSTIQLLVRGGSQLSSSHIEWSTNDSQIVEFEEKNLFKSKKIGFALIRAKSIGVDPLLGQSVVFGEDECSVHVVQLDSIQLQIPTREILPNKFVPLTVLPFDQSKNAILITDVYLQSLSFSWSLSNGHLAQFRPVIGNLTSALRTFVINLETFRTGRVTIDVRVTPTSKTIQKSIFRSSKELTSSIDVNILEPFYLNQFDETRTILLGPNSRLNLFHIPQDVTLEFVGNKGGISFDSKTKTLTSNDQNYDEAILYMKFRPNQSEKRSLQSTIVGAYLVQVKPIDYLLIQSSLPIETSTLFSAIPIDYKLPVMISSHDEFGRKFDATSTSFTSYSTRTDFFTLTSNQSHIFEFIPGKIGSNVVVFTGVQNDKLRTFLPIQSTSGFLLPTSTNSPLKSSYFINDIVCFQSQSTDEQSSRSDQWTGDDGMLVDSKFAIGQMIMDGERHLYLTIDGQTITSERFQVKIPDEIQLSKGNNEFLYNGGDKSKLTTFPIVFGSNSTTNLHGTCSRQGLEHALSIRTVRPNFECRLEFVNPSSPKASSLFIVEAIFDLNRMSWACQITSKSQSNDDELSTNDDSLRLTVQTSFPSHSNSLLIPFQPRFQLSPSSIYLSEENPFQSIQISTLAKNEKFLQFHSSDASIVKIRKNSTDPFLYNVELRHGAKSHHTDPIYIEIENTQTGQRERVEIQIQKRFIDNPIGRLLVSLLLCASLALIVYGLANRKTTSTVPSVHVPLISKPISSSPRVIHSPSTPKRNLLFDDQHSIIERNQFDSPILSTQDQPVVRLFSAQDLRSRTLTTTPRSAMSQMTLPQTDEGDLQRRLRRLYED